MDSLPTDPDLRFGLLWAQAEGAVAGYIHGLLHDRQAADELVQEVAVAAFRNFATCSQPEKFTSWTLGIASNLVKMRWRTISRSRTVMTDQALLANLADLSAEMEGEFEAERLALRDCLHGIHGRAWEMLRLHYWEGMAAPEVAARLGIAVGHVRVQLHRLRTVLHACIVRRLAAESQGG